MAIDGGQLWTMYQAVESITDQLGVCVCGYVGAYIYYNVCMKHEFKGIGSFYLVFHPLRLLLLMVVLVYAPDKVMEVVLEELLTVSLTH